MTLCGDFTSDPNLETYFRISPAELGQFWKNARGVEADYSLFRGCMTLTQPLAPVLSKQTAILGFSFLLWYRPD
jgi:hypothetical protein